MEKQSLWSRIKNFFIHLFALILSLFKKEEKKDNKEELQVFEENINRNRIKLKELDNTTLPDTQSTKASNEEETSTDNKEKEVILYKRDPKSEIMDVFKEIALTYDEDRIKEIIDEILKEEYDIDIKRTKKVIEENVEKLKEELLEDIKEKFEKEEFKKEEQLKEYLKEEMKKEIEEHPLEISRPPSKYVVATTVRENLFTPQDKKQIVTATAVIKTTPKKKKEQIKEKAANTKVAMLKTDEPAVIKPKDHLFVAAGTATVIAAGVATELIKPLKKQEDVIVPKEPEKEVELPKLKPEEIEIAHVTPDPVQLPTSEVPKKETPVEKEVEEKETELTVEQDIKEEKEQLQDQVQVKLNEFQYVDDHNDEVKSNELAQINKERLEKENEKIIEELKVIEEQIQALKDQKEEIEEAKEEQEEEEEQTIIAGAPTEEEPTKEEKKTEEQKETPPPAPDFDLTPNIDSAVKDSNIEMKSDKEIEDKKYDEYEQQLDELLYDIEMYRIKYDKSLNKEQKKK